MHYEFEHFLLIDRGGVASYYLAVLRSKGKINKASYFIDTVNIWNPASRLEESFMSTSTEFFIDKNKELESFEGDLTNFKRFCFTTFHNWFCNKKRKEQNQYQKTVEISTKDFYNIEDETDNPEQVIIKKEENKMVTNYRDLIHNYMSNEASEKEQFIYDHMIGLIDLEYDEKKYMILNYPGSRPITTRTYFNHKEKFRSKLKAIAYGGNNNA